MDLLKPMESIYFDVMILIFVPYFALTEGELIYITSRNYISVLNIR